MTLPTFITVGAEKCGTTALHAQLNNHPQIFMSNPKEPSYFASSDQKFINQEMRDLNHNYINNLEQYKSIFSEVNDEIAIGESSPCYLYSDSAAKMIKSVIPDVKIIIILRNPVLRAYSQFVFNQMRGWEARNIEFQSAIDIETSRIKNNSMWAFHYLARGMYFRQVEKYLEIFGDSNVKVILYDDYVERPDKTLDEIHSFIGVEKFNYTNSAEKHNVTRLSRVKFIETLINNQNKLALIIKKIIPNSVKGKISDIIQLLNSTKPKADPEYLLALEQHFCEDIKLLSTIIDKSPLIWLSKK